MYVLGIWLHVYAKPFDISRVWVCVCVLQCVYVCSATCDSAMGQSFSLSCVSFCIYLFIAYVQRLNACLWDFAVLLVIYFNLCEYVENILECVCVSVSS